MDERLSLAVFPTRSTSGQELLHGIEELAAKLRMEVAPIEQADGFDLIGACRTKDIVIFDATVEDESLHNYRAVTGELMHLEHALIVSRTALPLNIAGVREDGAPTHADAAEKSNVDILAWIGHQLNELQHAFGGGHRPRDLLGLRMWKEGFAERTNRLKSQGQIFISFRNDPQDPHALDRVEATKKRIESGKYHGGETKKVLYYPPGTLSSELMSEQRRWMIVSILRDRLAAADEIWVYETPSYYNSWWTLAELLTAAYLRGSRVCLYNPDTDQVRDAPEDYLPRLSKAQRRRAARWFANCTPDEMGPESAMALRMLRVVPLVNRIGFIRDHVWSEEFWDYPVLDCPACRDIGRNQNRFSVDDLLWMRGTHFSRLTPEELGDCLRAGEICCAGCRTVFAVRESRGPQYLWIPTGNARTLCELVARTWRPLDDWLVALPTYILG